MCTIPEQGPMTATKGRYALTRPSVSGQYIDLVRSGTYPWSIGMIYNSSTFAIGTGKSRDSSFTSPQFVITPAGDLGIGNIDPPYRLSVEGKIGGSEVIVESTQWSDYVFQPGYRLKPLSEVAAYIKQQHHLPEVPSKAEVRQNGVGLAEMQSKLLAKIGELTLHMIQEHERNDRLEQENRKLQDRIARLEAQDPPRGAAHAPVNEVKDNR
jgi:hypothetical protein